MATSTIRKRDIGHHVAIGDVIEMRLQATHLRSLKNEEVIVPNSQILKCEIVSFSSLAKE